MISVNKLLDAAKIDAIGDSFGDESFQDGLGRLHYSLEKEARLNSRGEALAENQIVQFLKRRLEIEYWYTQAPEIDNEEIVGPLIGLGLPRTGSTVLGCLLAEDPAVRSLRAWEAQEPCPPPESDTEDTDPRIARQIERNKFFDQLSPRVKTMLPISPTAPTECQMFMGYDFKSQLFQSSTHIPSYIDWLNHKADLVTTYQYVKRVLKLLQWRCPPRRWRLKNPAHMLFIDAVDKVFPDARYWMTHRDIGRVIPSVVDLYHDLSGPYTDRIDAPWIAEMAMAWTELGLQRVAEFRLRGNENRFFDVDFMEVQTNPIPVMERLYRFLGEDFTKEARAKMLAWRDDMPADKHGRHQYDTSQLAIDMDALSRRFAFYDHEAGKSR